MSALQERKSVLFFQTVLLYLLFPSPGWRRQWHLCWGVHLHFHRHYCYRVVAAVAATVTGTVVVASVPKLTSQMPAEHGRTQATAWDARSSDLVSPLSLGLLLIRREFGPTHPSIRRLPLLKEALFRGASTRPAWNSRCVEGRMSMPTWHWCRVQPATNVSVDVDIDALYQIHFAIWSNYST